MITSLRNPERQQKLMAALKSVADSGHYTEGGFSFKLEKQLSHLLNGQHATTFNSGCTAWYALFRYYASLGHSSVAIANNSYYAAGAMAVEAGYNVFLVDSCTDHPSMSVDSLASVLDHNKVGVVVLTHVGGWLARDYMDVVQLCYEHHLILLEDCIDVMGLKIVGGVNPGTLGDAGVWSMNPTKAIPAGEVGILTTPYCETRDYARSFRSCGRKMAGLETHYSSGMTLRISEWDAAVASTQLECLAEILASRKRDWEALQSIAPNLLPLEPTNYYKYPVTVEQASTLKLAGQVYGAAEQLSACLRSTQISSVNLVNSFRWTQAHRCLEIGEGLYDGMAQEDVKKMLRRV